MKFLTSIVLLASSFLPSHGQSSMEEVFDAFQKIDPIIDDFSVCTTRAHLWSDSVFDATWQIMNARKICQDVIPQFIETGTADQPACYDRDCNCKNLSIVRAHKRPYAIFFRYQDFVNA